jgi:hypothetical protein
MKGMYGFLPRGFACLAVALVILCVLALPAQGVRANDPSPDGGDSGEASCYGTFQPPDCHLNECINDITGKDEGPCDYLCAC